MEDPTVTLIIAAYNEEEVIERKINNSLHLAYPDDKLDIIVFSDASSDQTDKIVQSYADQGVKLRRIDGRVGKTECQNIVASEADSEVLVFSDANSIYREGAIKELVRKFDQNVGCVVGSLRYTQNSDVSGESFYWKYENKIKEFESLMNTLVTGNGAIYAIRNQSYVELPQDAISDFAEPLEIIKNGEKVKYTPKAIATEETSESVESELSRRVRIVTRSWNSITNYLSLLNPIRYPVFSFQLVSHKVLRWLSPLLLMLIFVTSLILTVLTDALVYKLAFLLNLGFYGMAAFGWIADQNDLKPGIGISIPYYFVVSNYGLLLGFLKFGLGENIVSWETEDRK